MVFGLLLLGALPCRSGNERSLVLTASAYNSLPEQTNAEPNVGAWGDVIEPGVKAIAVSWDLIPFGLMRGVEVAIDGLPGTYRVLDKMGQRWTQKIDIYMGVDVEAAQRWGVRPVRIRWREASPE
jgi:3D (Asp-Asp-Asp) domain-containing protein